MMFLQSREQLNLVIEQSFESLGFGASNLHNNDQCHRGKVCFHSRCAQKLSLSRCIWIPLIGENPNQCNFFLRELNKDS